MRPAEAPDPSPGELAAIREALAEPHVAEARCAVEGAETDEDRRRELRRFNERLRAAVERIEAEHVTPSSPPGP